MHWSAPSIPGVGARAPIARGPKVGRAGYPDTREGDQGTHRSECVGEAEAVGIVEKDLLRAGPGEGTGTARRRGSRTPGAVVADLVVLSWNPSEGEAEASGVEQRVTMDAAAPSSFLRDFQRTGRDPPIRDIKSLPMASSLPRPLNGGN